MKKIFCLFLGAMLSWAAAAQSTYYVAVDYTPLAASSGCGTSAINNAFSNAMTQINSQGVTTQLAPIPIAARQPLPDSSSMMSQFVWMQTNALAWQDRSNAQSVAGIVVSAPAGGASAVIPNMAVVAVKDATAAVDCSNMQYQMQQALAHIMGTTDAMGVQVRQRTYDGTNVCFHTQGAPKSDPNASLPYLGGYQTGNANSPPGGPVQSHAGNAADSCQQWLQWNVVAPPNGLGHSSQNYARAVLTGTTCQAYNSAGTGYETAYVTTYAPPPGGSTITCPNGNVDEEIPYYSCYGADCAVISAYKGTRSARRLKTL